MSGPISFNPADCQANRPLMIGPTHRMGANHER